MTHSRGPPVCGPRRWGRGIQGRSDPALQGIRGGRAPRTGREGLSQEELGFRADLDRTYVSGIERGVRNPTLMIIGRLAKALGTRPSRLLIAAERGGEA